MDMDNFFLGEIRAFGFAFAPQNWAPCAGQILAINQNAALFSLLGNAYGGDGFRTFGLPNLQNLLALDAGQGAGLSQYRLGQTGGATSVTLQGNQMPSHNHALMATNANGSAPKAAGGVLAAPQIGDRIGTSVGAVAYSTRAPTGPMDLHSIMLNGSGGAHNNMQPYLVLNFCIALVGLFPPRP